MKWWLSLVAFFLPAVSSAQQLVPVQCNSPQTCGSCELVALINNVIQFVIQISVVIAAIILVYAGLLLVTSTGNTNQLTKAKGLFFNVVIGLVVLLAAFLIVNTVMAALLRTGSPAFSWQTIECVYPNAARPLIPYTSTRITGGAGGGGGLLSGGLLNTAFYSNAGVCSQDFLDDYFTGNDVAVAACVAAGESSCGAYFESTTDRSRIDGSSFSLSSFQINLTVHDIEGCAAYGASSDYLNCSDAYTGTDYDAYVSNPTLYQQCAAALADPRCAATNAARLQERDGWSIWSAYSRNNCG